MEALFREMACIPDTLTAKTFQENLERLYISLIRRNLCRILNISDFTLIILFNDIYNIRVTQKSTIQILQTSKFLFQSA